MNALDNVIEKVKALLRKAHDKAVSKEEAALYAGKAQELMTRHGIEVTIADLHAGKKDEEITSENLISDCCQKDRYWLGPLMMRIAEVNGCMCYVRGGDGGRGFFYFIGTKTDGQTSRYVAGWLRSLVDDQTKHHCPAMSDKYRRDFKYGCVQAINEKLRSHRKAAIETARKELGSGLTGNELMIVNNAIIKVEQQLAKVTAWQNEKFKLKDGQSRSRSTNVDARAHGYSVGKTLNVNSGASAALGSGAKALSH
jgi:hypothetical protein